MKLAKVCLVLYCFSHYKCAQASNSGSSEVTRLTLVDLEVQQFHAMIILPDVPIQIMTLRYSIKYNHYCSVRL